LKIRSIEIKNYRSLHDVKMTELDDFVILIGKNGSGKSNILEALELFFTDLDLQNNNGKSFDPSTWYDKRTQKPIDFVIELEMNTDDLERLFNEEILKRINIKDSDRIGSYFKIHRRIEVNMWKNMESQLGDLFKIRDGKIFETAKSIEKPLVTTESETTAAPTVESVVEKALSPDISNMIFANIHSYLKNKFKLIRSPRESPERPAATIRPTIIDPESKSYLNRLAVSPSNREEEDVWADFETQFDEFSGRQLRVRGNIFEFRSGSLSLPIELSGSGDQALMILMRHFLDQKPFYGIEEPETRLHMDYQRKLFRYLKAISEKRQVFIATHSPVFVDKAFLKQTFLVSVDGHQQTKLKRVERDDLKLILLELGIMPSDFFFANRALFVEGLTEKYVLPIIAEKCDIDFANVSIIPLHGKDKKKYHLKVWVEAAGETNLPIFLLLDKVAEKEIKAIEGEHLIDRENYHILCKKQLEKAETCDFEDYYPKDILQVVINELKTEKAESAKTDSSKGKFELKNDEPVVKRIDDFLGRTNWKIEVATKVAEQLSKEEIEENMEEIVRFLRKVAK
jgi:predicted ATP-dependent endonuclease of OLD family